MTDPKRRRWVAWDETGAEVQCAVWRKKLEAAEGNITRAARSMGFSPRHGFRLTRVHGLNAFAEELRVRATGRKTGRPTTVDEGMVETDQKQ